MTKINIQENGDHYNTYTQDLSLSPWLSGRGIMMVRRSALELNDPEHEFNYCKRLLEGTGLSPQNFGIVNPKAERFKDLTRESLEDMVVELEGELTSAIMHL